jgi:hypothetical protein
MSAVLKEEEAFETDSVEEQSTEFFVLEALDPNRTPYNIAEDEFNVNVNPYPQLKRKKIITTHVVRRPTIEEEERKERMTPLLTKSAGKVGDVQASQTNVDIIPGDRYLYNKVIRSISGYSLPGIDPTKTLDPHTKVQVRDPETGENVEKELVDVIPDDHKSLVVNSIFPSNPNNFEVVENDEVVGFSLVGGQEWTIRQFIGGREQQEDGTFSAPDFVVDYVFNEPSANDMKGFRTKAFAVKTWRDKDGIENEERRIILPVLIGLFDRLVSIIDGVTIDRGETGETFDVHKKEHLAFIPPAFKKNAVLKLFSFLQADLGKSASA